MLVVVGMNKGEKATLTHSILEASYSTARQNVLPCRGNNPRKFICTNKSAHLQCNFFHFSLSLKSASGSGTRESDQIDYVGCSQWPPHEIEIAMP